MEEMRGFLGFAICFAVLMWIWHAHHTYFRRYGLTDELTIALNTGLLFLVLFYVYPLKFTFALATGHLHDPGRGDPATLYLIYSLGFVGIFGLFLMLYAHAWRKRDQLQLNAVELHDTKTSMMMYGAYIAIGLASVLISLVAKGRMLSMSGWIFFLLGPVSAFIGGRRGAMRRQVQATLESTALASTTPTPDRTADRPTPSPA
jgi:uncharacterized membrane protein